MKIGIVTITELDNFGNRLQNYALQSYLQSYDIQVETIPNYIIYKNRKNYLYKAKKIVKGVLKALIKRNINLISELYKQRRFEKFDRHYFTFSKEYSTIDYISPKLNAMYDYFIAGSDQIWNPYFTFNFDFNFLQFADINKRIAYAASFGVSELPEKDKECFKKYLDGMKCISVREFAGQKIVKELTGKDIPVVLDPTLLLTKEQWLKIEKKPKWIKQQKYILTYYLGDVAPRDTLFNRIKIDYPEFKNMQIIDIHDTNKIRAFSITPDEFIWLIHNASLMITDSFHGTVFSVIMNTPFITQNRVDNYVQMNSRIESLYQLLKIDSNELVHMYGNDIENINNNIENNRIIAHNYLLNALGISYEDDKKDE